MGGRTTPLSVFESLEVEAQLTGGWPTLAALSGRLVCVLSGDGVRKTAYASHEAHARLCFADIDNQLDADGHRVFVRMSMWTTQTTPSLPSIVMNDAATSVHLLHVYNANSELAFYEAVTSGAHFVSTTAADTTWTTVSPKFSLSQQPWNSPGIRRRRWTAYEVTVDCIDNDPGGNILCSGIDQSTDSSRPYARIGLGLPSRRMLDWSQLGQQLTRYDAHLLRVVVILSRSLTYALLETTARSAATLPSSF